MSIHISPKQAMTTTINGRSYVLTENTKELPNLRAHIIGKGFDGSVWYGFSARNSRQRKDLYSLVYRTQEGRFIIGTTV